MNGAAHQLNRIASKHERSSKLPAWREPFPEVKSAAA